MGSIARLRRPEYTGENRCWPCTVANVAILLACCLALAVFSFPLALAALLAGAITIRVRGYLVPYTPQLVSRLRGTREPDRRLTGSIAPTDEDELGQWTVEALVGSGVIVPDEERLHLAEAFRADWRAEMARLRALSREELVEATAAATRNSDVELLDVERPLLVLTGPEGGEAWVSRPIAIAEIAADRALESHVPELSNRERLAAARASRGFLDRCPVCETPTEETPPNTCCGGVHSKAALSGTVLVCPTCDEALYRFDEE